MQSHRNIPALVYFGAIAVCDAKMRSPIEANQSLRVSCKLLQRATHEDVQKSRLMADDVMILVCAYCDILTGQYKNKHARFQYHTPIWKRACLCDTEVYQAHADF